MRKPLNQYLPDYIYLAALAGLVVIVDQLTKAIVRVSLDFSQVWTPTPSIAQYFRIVHWRNTGAAFGIFQNGNTIFLLLGIFVTLAIINFYPIIPRHDRWLRAALALQLGGAIGNLVDRIFQGHVTDFFSFMTFPVFNIADAAISIGVVLILVPFLPQVIGEIESSRSMKAAQQLNRLFRETIRVKTDEEEVMTLGLIEVLWADHPSVRKFSLEQDVRRIRSRMLSTRKGTSRG